MRRAFVIGHPIAHSRSPLIHGYWLAEHAIEGSYERIDVAPDELAHFIRSLGERGFVGGNVTIPHKETVLRLVDVLTPRARSIGAVNTLVLDDAGTLHGDNTDAAGFTSHLRQTLGQVWTTAIDGTVLVLGAGGASRAIVAGLVEQGARRVVVANRTPERAQAVAALAPDQVHAVGWDAIGGILTGTSLLVNTTSLGMNDRSMLDLDLSPLPDEAVVSDIVYTPLDTGLLRAARLRGLKTVDGLGMLLHQAVPGFEAWFGRRPSVTTGLRQAIVADLAT